MKTAKLLTLFCCLSLICAVAAPRAAADEWNKETVVTFSGPVMVGNTRLDAGTYVFKLADSDGNRHIVQIFNQDQNHVFATIMAIPDYRVTPADKTTIKFSETAEGSTQSGTLDAAGVPIKEWFYPGDNFGQEFKVRPAAASTEAVAEPAPSATAEPAEAAEAPAQPEPATTEAQPAAQEAAPTEPQPEGQQAAPAETEAAKPLPKTASSVPLIALVSALSLAVAGSLALLRKRIG